METAKYKTLNSLRAVKNIIEYNAYIRDSHNKEQSMIDSSDKHTMTLSGIKRAVKRGRKPLFSDSMTPAQRKARQRREQDRLILENDSEVWTESDCMRVLSTKKFNVMHKFAWEQLGRLREYM